MQIPRRFNSYCPHCDGHHEMEVEKVRTGRSTGMKWGQRQQKRRTKSIGNQGRFSKVPAGKKPSEKTNLKYRCSNCGKAHQREGTRTRQLELTE